MKKYLVQFCLETDEKTGEIGGIRPQYLPTKGVILECDNESLSNIMGGIFENFPNYRTAIVSEIGEFEKNKELGMQRVVFQFIAVNNGWNGKKAKGYTVDIPVDMFNMMG